MKDNKLVELSTEFAVDILKLSHKLQQQDNGKIISNQICRSGTSIGANIHEAQYAQSRADFINKLQIALKEANKTKYWVTLIDKTNILPKDKCEELSNKCTTLRVMLINSIKTAKQNN